MPLKSPSSTILLLVCSLLIFGCSSMIDSQTKNMNKNNGLGSNKLKGIDSLSQFERNIAKKLMLSIRYFCEQSNLSKDGSEENDLKENDSGYKIRCLNPVVQLSPSLNSFLSQIELAGVVLFSENIVTVEQTKQLTTDIQKAGRKAGSSNYLIGIDQEGGRVVRIPRDIATSFSGNMAIGATYDQFGDQFSATVGSIIGKELDFLGLNLNFSPSIDVNNNPDNPVINIRSFGEDPGRVSELGLAMMNSLQEQNVMATLKHFPGHGNTHVDSHTGLPSVDLSKDEMDRTEFAPFKYAIEKGEPAMVMTAHIQYPQLDPTEVVNKYGESIVVPATMSHKLMTKILKEELGFKGIVITDAMNMAGISANFDLAEATAHSFLAGVDISLMPYPVRNQKDIDDFISFVKKIAQLMEHITANNLSKSYSKYEMLTHTAKSVATIEAVKLKYQSSINVKNTSQWTHNKYRKLEQTLAEKSISALRLDDFSFPLNKSSKDISIHILIRNKDQMEVVENAFEFFEGNDTKKQFKLNFTLLNQNNLNAVNFNSEIEHLIIFEQDGSVSAVDIGEAGDEIIKKTNLSLEQTLNTKNRINTINHYLDLASKKSIPTTLVASQSPYDVIPYLDERYNSKINNILVAYDASVYWDTENKKKVGKGFRAVVSALIGRTEVQGKLPVNI
ncbi:MAG: beta-N-acetylhexosaminidase [Polaribacter sp.]|jgi:beta-N-acetylhexosaminidase